MIMIRLIKIDDFDHSYNFLACHHFFDFLD